MIHVRQQRSYPHGFYLLQFLVIYGELDRFARVISEMPKQKHYKHYYFSFTQHCFQLFSSTVHHHESSRAPKGIKEGTEVSLSKQVCE